MIVVREQRKPGKWLSLVSRLVERLRQRAELGGKGGSSRGYRNGGTKLVVSAGLVVNLDRLGRTTILDG